MDATGSTVSNDNSRPSLSLGLSLVNSESAPDYRIQANSQPTQTSSQPYVPMNGESGAAGFETLHLAWETTNTFHRYVVPESKPDENKSPSSSGSDTSHNTTGKASGTGQSSSQNNPSYPIQRHCLGIELHPLTADSKHEEGRFLKKDDRKANGVPDGCIFWEYHNEKLSVQSLRGIANCRISEHKQYLIQRIVARLEKIGVINCSTGQHLKPISLVYKRKDNSNLTTDVACTFVNFPFLAVDIVDKQGTKTLLSNPLDRRTLLQGKYRLWAPSEKDAKQFFRNTKNSASPRQIIYVPQFWALVAGTDTIFSFTNEHRVLAATRHDPYAEDGSGLLKFTQSSTNAIPQMTTVLRIRVTDNGRLQKVIFPMHLCRSWFGLCNKIYRVLDNLEKALGENDKRHHVPILSSDQERITIDNWTEKLQKAKNNETIDIRLIDVSQNASKSRSITYSFAKPTDKEPKGYRERPGSDKTDILDSNDGMPIALGADSSKTSSAGKEEIRNTSAVKNDPVWQIPPRVQGFTPFLVWPAVNDDGNKVTDQEGRIMNVVEIIMRTLDAIFRTLPVDLAQAENSQDSETDTSGTATSSVPQVVISDFDQDISMEKLRVIPKDKESVDSAVKGDQSIRGHLWREIIDLIDMFWHYYIPQTSSLNSQVYGLIWGIMDQLLKKRGPGSVEPFVDNDLRAVRRELTRIVELTRELHRGAIYWSGPSTNQYQLGEGAILLSAVVDAFRDFIKALIELSRGAQDEKSLIDLKQGSKLERLTTGICDSLKIARSHLVADADKRSENRHFGPFATPEMILIQSFDKLARGIDHDASKTKQPNVVAEYDERLQDLVQEIEKTPSRSQLVQLNHFEEQIDMLDHVFKEQEKVLKQLEKNLDPNDGALKSIMRRINFSYEKAAISDIVSYIKENQEYCKELRERLQKLSAQNLQAVEGLQDRISKVLMLFTVLTIIFLPPTFIAGYLGMNLTQLANNALTQGEFWAIAVPVTLLVLLISIFLLARGEKILNELQHWMKNSSD